MSRDEKLALIESVIDAARARLVTAETGYTQGELDDMDEALRYVREMRREP